MFFVSQFAVPLGREKNRRVNLLWLSAPLVDLAGYHIAAHADVQDIDAVWIDEEEPDLGPAGAKGIGEVGIVGTAAATASAVYHATGIRVRDLPIRLDKLLRGNP